MTSGGDPVAAITERDARGEIAACYADIRQTLGVPVVNLVWRHLATIDGALPWAWQAVRPAYRSGAVDLAADRLKAQLRLPALPRIPAEVFFSVGLSEADLNAIQSVLNAYDRSNPMNWLALSALLKVVQPSTAGSTATRQPPQAIQQAGTGTAQASPPHQDHRNREASDNDNRIPDTLPPLPAIEALEPHTARLVLRMDTLANETNTRPILASMYRHLSHWPPYLAVLWVQLSNCTAPDHLTLARDQVILGGEPYVAALANELRQCPAHASAPQEALDALHDFMTRVGLPRMIAITRMAKIALTSVAASSRAD